MSCHFNVKKTQEYFFLAAPPIPTSSPISAYDINKPQSAVGHVGNTKISLRLSSIIEQE